jgi:hypothetical protein
MPPGAAARESAPRATPQGQPSRVSGPRPTPVVAAEEADLAALLEPDDIVEEDDRETAPPEGVERHTIPTPHANVLVVFASPDAAARERFAHSDGGGIVVSCNNDAESLADTGSAFGGRVTALVMDCRKSAPRPAIISPFVSAKIVLWGAHPDVRTAYERAIGKTRLSFVAEGASVEAIDAYVSGR